MRTEMEQEALEQEAVDTQDAVEEDDTRKLTAEEKKKLIIAEIISWVKTVVIAFAVAMFLNHFIIVNSYVPTGSMETTIMPGDRLMGLRLAYKSHEPERGDIIIFKYPLDESQVFIKRLIGLPGEHLEIHEGKVYIDYSREPLEEPYLHEEWIEENDGIVYDIPEDCFFMMGDNRNNSLDGRYWAEYAVAEGLADHPKDAISKKLCFVQRDQIVAKALFRYYPRPKNMSKNPYE